MLRMPVQFLCNKTLRHTVIRLASGVDGSMASVCRIIVVENPPKSQDL